MSETTPTVTQTLIQNAVLSADMVAVQPHHTEAARTRAIVTRAVEFLIGNGLITVTPQKNWPEWLTLEPPFDPEFPFGPPDGSPRTASVPGEHPTRHADGLSPRPRSSHPTTD